MPAKEPPKTQSTSDVVSQSEIENLLAMVGGESGDVGATAGIDGGDGTILHRYEFPNVSSLSSIELRKLRMRHEDFIQALASRLSLHFRIEINLQMLRLETMPFRQFIDTLNNPTNLSLFRLEPFRGVSLLDMPLKLALCLIDRELGGTARVADDARDLSKMEARLLARIVEIIMGEWCSSWSDTLDLRPTLLRTENNGRFVQSTQPQAAMLVLGIETRIGSLTEPIQFCFPCTSLEPILAKLNQEPEMQEAGMDDVAKILDRWNPEFDEMDMNLTAELPDVEITARQLGDLKAGDVIPFSALNANRVRVQLEESSRYIGNLGVSGNQLAIQISRILKE